MSISKIDLSQIDLNGEIPLIEPERQYYYIGKMKEWVRKEELRLGRKLTACTQTFGCQMNSRDSEKLLGILEEIGYEETASEEADFVIYNTCTVRENANLKVYGKLGFLQTLKKKNPNMRIALCGCMMQEEKVVEKIKKSYRFVDIIFGTHNIYKLAELMWIRKNEDKMTIDIWEGTKDIIEDLPNERKYSFKS
ncbi:MAG: tRNA (N6-isopentenyl adenosine(37)-C2)-methylthiotransferase MiaB, partial [Clostridiales bacterium]|nr:tRNA (N6-isopentenyl adenosine(37)-C2)-methylthiotransferase MiaB [Clostridiales bacterium]